MKACIKSITIFALLFVCVPAHGDKQEAEKFAEDFPGIFWCTLKEWENLDGATSIDDSYEYFIDSRSCEVVGKVKAGDTSSFWEFHVFYSDNSEEEGEGWDFVFRLDEDGWHAVSGVRKVDGMTLSLLRDDPFSPGMRAQLEQVLSLYKDGELDAAIQDYVNPDELTKAPKYRPLVGEDSSGSGFHFRSGKNSYIASTMHQFGDSTPRELSSVEFDAPIKVTRRVKKGKDIQVLRYESPELNEVEALVFDPSHPPSIDERIYLYGRNKVFGAKIALIGENTGKCLAFTSEPIPAAGMSGSPVVSAKSGTVIGVLIGADSATEARSITFELLRLGKSANQGVASDSDKPLD